VAKGNGEDTQRSVEQFLYAQSEILDERRWDDWLEHYAEDAVFWVPSYTLRGELVDDPELSVNLIYITSRAGLEDRIYRIRTGESAASTPLPNTSHMVTNIRAVDGEAGLIDVGAAFQVSVWSDRRGAGIRAGRYEYKLRSVSGDYLIQSKKVVLIDEVIDGWFDVISI